MNDQFYQAQAPKRSYAADFRAQARNMLKNRWVIAVMVGLLATILGNAGSSFGFNFNFNLDQNELTHLFDQFRESGDMQMFLEGVLNNIFYSDTVRNVFIGLIGLGAVTSFALQFFVGGPVAVGYARFNLELIDSDKEPSVGTLFSAFRTCYWKSVGARVLVNLIQSAIAIVTVAPMLIFLAMVLFRVTDGFGTAILMLLVGVPFALAGSVISMIVTYQYYFVPYILAEYPTVGVLDALRSSRNLMKGNKFRLFCLQFSFIGWALLAGCCTCGLGMLVLNPYMTASATAFYHEIARRDDAKTVEFPSIDPEDYFPQ